jgi:CDGSH-type Zn-finger protein
MTPMVKNFAKCGCGRTMDLEGYCDGSHALSEAEYTALQDSEEIDWGDDAESKTIKVEFAPGCFDNFDGTQEELEELMVTIQAEFEGKTQDEIEDMVTHVNLDDLLAEDPEFAKHIMNIENERKLQ